MKDSILNSGWELVKAGGRLVLIPLVFGCSDGNNQGNNAQNANVPYVLISNDPKHDDTGPVVAGNAVYWIKERQEVYSSTDGGKPQKVNFPRGLDARVVSGHDYSTGEGKPRHYVCGQFFNSLKGLEENV